MCGGTAVGVGTRIFSPPLASTTTVAGAFGQSMRTDQLYRIVTAVKSMAAGNRDPWAVGTVAAVACSYQTVSTRPDVALVAVDYLDAHSKSSDTCCHSD